MTATNDVQFTKKLGTLTKFIGFALKSFQGIN